MPKFQIPSAPQYQKRSPSPSTSQNPTLSSLYSVKNEERVKITVPLVTNAFDVKFGPIYLNKKKFEPGQTYMVHPLIAAELQTAINNFNESIMLQVQKKNNAGIPQFTGGFQETDALAVLEEPQPA